MMIISGYYFNILEHSVQQKIKKMCSSLVADTDTLYPGRRGDTVDYSEALINLSNR